MKLIRSIILSLLAVMLFAGCSNEDKLRNALHIQTEPFQYVNQNEKPFGTKELKGKVWIADFVFTSCTTVCSPMTANLTRIQKMAKEKNLDVQFVSFSVDPTVDTPQKLQEFADKYEMDKKKWNLLTGYTQDEIEQFAKKSFQAFVDKPEQSDQVIHGTSFYLVDQKGVVVKKYDGVRNTPYEEVVNDIKRITK